MGWQPGEGDHLGIPSGPARSPRDPETTGPSNATAAPVRNPRLSGFAKDGEWDVSRPSAALAAVLEDVSGPEWRCPGASRDEMLGMLRQAQALEARAAAVKLGVLRALVRDDDQPLPGGGYHGDLPEGWSKSLTHEVALDLSMPVVSADRLMWVAWDLQARLPGIGGLLADGILTYAKAKVVSETFLLLSDQDAARAEEMILPELPGKTFGQVKRLAEQAAITVDPEAAARRREHAEQNDARVTMYREDSGAVALSGHDLPTDQALSGFAHVCARAQEYKDSGAFPADVRMDQFRATAYLDLLNSKPAEERIACGQLVTVTWSAEPEAGATQNAEADDRAGGRATPDHPADDSASGGTGDSGSSDGGSDDGGPGDHEPGGGTPGSRGDGGSPGLPGGGGSANPVPPRLTDLVLPLATLLGLAERPGESHGLGPLDPALCRDLALAAISSRWTRLCVTVTDASGVAIGHGCARQSRSPRAKAPERTAQPPRPRYDTRTGPELPAQANLTIPAARLAELTATGPPGDSTAPWSFTRADAPEPPGGFDTWILSLPDGRQLSVALEPVPTFECDHRHQTPGYQPGTRLRHLVQVRDYTCTFPTCNRHARESDFEHATPFEKGGTTCACNAGARSRACHQVKQSPGWKVTQQPLPGWHQWQTPSGRTYTQPPKRYPS